MVGARYDRARCTGGIDWIDSTDYVVKIGIYIHYSLDISAGVIYYSVHGGNTNEQLYQDHLEC